MILFIVLGPKESGVDLGLPSPITKQVALSDILVKAKSFFNCSKMFD